MKKHLDRRRAGWMVGIFLFTPIYFYNVLQNFTEWWGVFFPLPIMWILALSFAIETILIIIFLPAILIRIPHVIYGILHVPIFIFNCFYHNGEEKKKK